MASEMLTKAISTITGYLSQKYTTEELQKINIEIESLAGLETPSIEKGNQLYTYEQVQETLSTINEKESIRKAKGVYYTPSDVVRFILFNSFKLVTGKLKPNNLHVMDLNGIPYRSVCFKKNVFDPTCGAGEFLLAALEIKMDLLDLHHAEVTKSKIRSAVKTIKGNDINLESVIISKLRLYLSVLHRHGVEKTVGLSGVINTGFSNYDYVSKTGINDEKYDVIIGNPPYVEESKSGLILEKSYGNIYANVLDNAAHQLNEGGTLGFIIPLSYVSTPRMKKIRESLYAQVPEQYLLNYSDRPDCLFASVHQKLTVMFARKKRTTPEIYTGSYTYWYKDEREELFSSALVAKNNFVDEQFIPKIGSKMDADIYGKINKQPESLISLFDGGDNSIHLNMRAAFWIKAFLNEHSGSEYKKFSSSMKENLDYAMCLLNSSLFWWFWICVSDCWHITRKELNNFRIPKEIDFEILGKLALNLENKLEETKVYVRTKQTEYEYKHKLCVNEIHAIDDYINEQFGLSKEESLHIKNFAYRYRVSGGAKK
ncbi:TPA: Eco57I restriction-modification methylase domain-containing protein [Streptococcus suis]